MPTGVTEVTGFGPGPAGFGTVPAVRVIFIGEEHDPLMTHLDLDIAEEVGADPEHFTQGVVGSMANRVLEMLFSLLSLKLVKL